MTLLNLADRVEAAAGADRKLDAAVWWETHKHADTDPELRLAFEADPAKALDEWCGVGWRHELQFPPRYTASLDAAMSLVPSWALPNLRHDSDRMRFFCQLENGLGRPFKGYAGYGETYALALCAAILRALAEQGQPTPAIAHTKAIGDGSSEILGRQHRGGGVSNHA